MQSHPARLTVLLLVAFTSACGALFNSKTSTVQLNSNPTGLDVFVDGNRVGTTPISVELSVKEGHTVVFRSEDGQEVTCIVNRKVGAGWVILDVLGGLIPIVIDAATGSWYELDKEVCNANLGDGGEEILAQSIESRSGYRGSFSDLPRQ